MLIELIDLLSYRLFYDSLNKHISGCYLFTGFIYLFQMFLFCRLTHLVGLDGRNTRVLVRNQSWWSRYIFSLLQYHLVQLFSYSLSKRWFEFISFLFVSTVWLLKRERENDGKEEVVPAGSVMEKALATLISESEKSGSAGKMSTCRNGRWAHLAHRDEEA